jgi:hypothetical protein
MSFSGRENEHLRAVASALRDGSSYLPHELARMALSVVKSKCFIGLSNQAIHGV